MLFLHGGGDHPDFRHETLGRFVQAAMQNGRARIAMITAETTVQEAQQSYSAYHDIFATFCDANVVALEPIYVSPNAPLLLTQLEAIKPTGIFICGGMMPIYHAALCIDNAWLAYMSTHNIPYCGTSAGAAVAAEMAVLGGWRVVHNGREREIIFRGAAEGLDPVTVSDGLGLSSLSVDVHAGQMGTLPRLLHAMQLNQISRGLAIDENTMVELSAESQIIGIYGRGQAYLVGRDHSGDLHVQILDSM